MMMPALSTVSRRAAAVARPGSSCCITSTSSTVRAFAALAPPRPSRPSAQPCPNRPSYAIRPQAQPARRASPGSRSLSASRVTAQQQQQAEAEAPRQLDAGEQNIHDILTKQFKPKELKVQDVSGGCGSFYAIIIASSQFKGKPTIAAHRMVNEALKDVIQGIHGLQLKTAPADE